MNSILIFFGAFCFGFFLAAILSASKKADGKMDYFMAMRELNKQKKNNGNNKKN